MTDSSPGGGPMRLYDTARREVVPVDPGELVTIYTSGNTPYDPTRHGAHQRLTNNQA